MNAIKSAKRIECRYQHYTKNGVEWTNWFAVIGEPVCSESECKARLKELVTITPRNRKGKLRHEYRIVDAEEPKTETV